MGANWHSIVSALSGRKLYLITSRLFLAAVRTTEQNEIDLSRRSSPFPCIINQLNLD